MLQRKGKARRARCAARSLNAALLAAQLVSAQVMSTKPAAAVEAKDDIVLGALVAEFLLAVAGSLSEAPAPDSGYPKGTFADAAQLSRLVDASGAAIGSAADLDIALGSFLAFASDQPKDADLPFDAKSARDFACHLVGSDPVGFAELGRRAGIDGDGAKSCARKFAETAARWNEHFSSYRQGPGLTPPEGSGPLYVEIAPVFNPANQAIADTLRTSQLYDALAERLNAEMALPSGRVLLVTECGGTQAFYNPERREIVLCDERIAAWINAAEKQP